jgi:hypothetical protein
MLSEPWDRPSFAPIHPTNDFGAALTNVTETCRILPGLEQKYLQSTPIRFADRMGQTNCLQP